MESNMHHQEREERVTLARVGNGVSKDRSKTHSKECTGIVACLSRDQSFWGSRFLEQV